MHKRLPDCACFYLLNFVMWSNKFEGGSLRGIGHVELNGLDIPAGDCKSSKIMST